MKSSDFIEKIPLSIVSDAKGRYAVIIINTTGNSSITESLATLYAHSSYKTGLVESDIDSLNETIAICSGTGSKLIVLGDNAIPKFSLVTPASGFSCTLISSGSFNGKKGNLLDSILDNEKVSDFSHIGFQQYKYDPLKLHTLRERYFETLRLGLLRESLPAAEPLIRGKEYIFFDMNSIRVSDFPENHEKAPNGLYAEEACQLGRYIGMNQEMRICYIFGYKPESLPESSSSQLVAEIIWHISEGVASSVEEDPSKSEKDEYFHRKIISMGDEGQDMIFVTSSFSGRWWMEIPEFKNNRTRYVPCSLSDYQSACNGEVPLRWIFFFQKINPN
jgi:hypothetical protein